MQVDDLDDSCKEKTRRIVALESALLESSTALDRAREQCHEMSDRLDAASSEAADKTRWIAELEAQVRDLEVFKSLTLAANAAANPPVTVGVSVSSAGIDPGSWQPTERVTR